MRSPWMLLVPAALAAAGVVAAAALGGGCGSCGQCPTATVTVSATDNVDIDIKAVAWAGPACPDSYPMCRGDNSTTNCTHMTITGRAPGQCQMAIQFGSGLVQVLTMEWGPQAKSCCGGFPVIGESTFYIASGQDAGIMGVDGPTDAVYTVPPDASANDGGADAGD